MKNKKNFYFLIAVLLLVIAIGFFQNRQKLFLTSSTVVTQSTKPQHVNPSKSREEDNYNNPVPLEKDLIVMSTLDIRLFYERYVMSPQVICSSIVRKGKILDGGWELCTDPLYVPDPKNCLVYSFGIKDDFSYDDDMMEYGCEVHSFDPSMTVGDHKRGDKGHFHKVGIAGENTTVSVNGTSWQLFTLASFRAKLGHTAEKRRLDVVKMDVESAELKALKTALTDGSLEDVRQLNFEVHNYLIDISNVMRKNLLRYLNLLRDIYKAGFRIYYTHRNLNTYHRDEKLKKEMVACHEIYMLNTNRKETGKINESNRIGPNLH